MLKTWLQVGPKTSQVGPKTSQDGPSKQKLFSNHRLSGSHVFAVIAQVGPSWLKVDSKHDSRTSQDGPQVVLVGLGLGQVFSMTPSSKVSSYPPHPLREAIAPLRGAMAPLRGAKKLESRRVIL